jgi:hypothetical protein
MSDQDFKSFNDPALRAAVRRVWSDERAPQELRQRITAMCGPRVTAGRRSESVSMRIRSSLYGLAAAAVFLLAVGIVFEDWSAGGRQPRRAPRVIALPAAMSANLYARHDADAKTPNHQLAGISQTNFKLMGQQLQQRLNFPVLAANLPGEGWKFHGASVCSVGSIVTAHLVFDLRGKEYVSIFSMSATDLSGSAPGCDYSEISPHHLMAGFTTQIGFYCVVATSVDESITIEEIRTIRDELKPIITDAPPTPGGQLAAILPH